MADFETPFVIKKVKKAAHAHHGGAWKIAYADFVTAMMAFFLLLWLISMTTPEQKKGLADYFAATAVSDTSNGAGGVLGGTAFDDLSAKMSGSNSDSKSFTAPESSVNGPAIRVTSKPNGTDGAATDTTKTSDLNFDSKLDQQYHAAAESIRQAWQANPDLTQVASNLVVQETKNGVDIQIMDQQGRPMFPEGSKFPYEVTRKAIATIAPILQKLSNQIEISGHTATGVAYNDPHYGPWELSMDRANAVREILGEFGLSDDHFDSVIGRGTADPLFPNDPYLAGNGRVVITLLQKAPAVPPGMSP